ncbi:GGDEF domain-containing protein [Marinicrinis sediminis]|uniref:GGDEF domain-containing protein n=1 Tax=Marinicrinis sediminis TaxID=1652465 RepID=A0ABW5RA86_9BACL
MIQLRPFDTHFTDIVSKQLQQGRMGLISLDISGMSEIEREYGRGFCEQIVRSMREVASELKTEFPTIFAVNQVSDDVFIYVNLSDLDGSNAHQWIMDWSKLIKFKVEHRLRHMYGDQPDITLHTGSTVVESMPETGIDSMIYTAMKKVIREARTTSRNEEHHTLSLAFGTIMEEKRIQSVYQPIVSLTNGVEFGYEALTRGPKGSPFESPLKLFDYAERQGCLHMLDRLARETAILGSHGLKKEQKIFINIPANVIHDSEFTPGQTLRILEERGILPQNVVFEITERSSIEDFSTVKRILHHYRRQGYQIAIDDAGAGYSSLEAIAELHPDFIKVDRSLIHGIHQDKIKEYILETLVTFAQKMNIRIIAEGIEEYPDLDKLMRMGVHFAQGYLLGRPNPKIIDIAPELGHHIIQEQRRNASESLWSIGDLATPIASFSHFDPVSKVTNHFRQQADEQGAVIVRGEEPVGLIMKEKLFQQLAGQYGVSLFWNRSITQLMDSYPLVVDEKLSVEQVSQLAMSRDNAKLYDYVIITSHGKLKGVASIRSILECITNVRMEHAKVANPLTGLPGNQLIQRELNQYIIQQNQPFSVVYADLDYFKWYNDCYGFQRGDELIQYTANMIQQAVNVLGNPDDFVGHIGGDDFIVISSTEHAQQLCEEMIRRFDANIQGFYFGEEICQVVDREGNCIQAQGVRLSLSLVVVESEVPVTPDEISKKAARLKKKAKSHPGSVYYMDKLGEARL